MISLEFADEFEKVIERARIIDDKIFELEAKKLVENMLKKKYCEMNDSEKNCINTIKNNMKNVLNEDIKKRIIGGLNG